jgi:hypothetical protein
MAYVHEECILDWIGRKMERFEGLQLPECEICRMPYSARLKVGSKKLCYSTLGLKVGLLSLKEKWLYVYYCVGILFCLFLLSRAFMQLFSLLFECLLHTDLSRFTV